MYEPIAAVAATTAPQMVDGAGALRILSDSGEALTTSFETIAAGVYLYAPRIIIAILILVLGWVIGAFLERAVREVIRSLKMDRALSNVGVDELVSHAGMQLNSGSFIGGLIKWFIIAVFLVAAVNVLGLTELNAFLNGIVLSFLPNIIISALVLMIAAVLSDVTQRLVYFSAKGTGVKSAHLLGLIAKWAIWIFALLVVMNQLRIGAEFAQILFTGIVFMVALAGGLAFGLGGRDWAAGVLGRVSDELDGRKYSASADR